MSPDTSQLLEAARALPQAERFELASALWESIEDDWSVQLSPEWRAEIRRRIAESDRGEGVSLTEEEFEQRLQARYGPLAD